jgi:hypothetical protein
MMTGSGWRDSHPHHRRAYHKPHAKDLHGDDGQSFERILFFIRNYVIATPTSKAIKFFVDLSGGTDPGKNARTGTQLSTTLHIHIYQPKPTNPPTHPPTPLFFLPINQTN